MQVLAPFIFLAILGILGFAGFGGFHWVLAPIDRAAEGRPFAMQFTLADLLCLFVLVQLPVGLVHWAARDDPTRQGEVIGDIVVVVIMVAVWWNYVGTLSRAGIHVVWHRCMVLAVALPVAFIGSVALAAVPFAVFVLIAEHVPAGYWLLLAEPLLVGVLYGLGRFTRAIVASAEARRGEPPPVPTK